MLGPQRLGTPAARAAGVRTPAHARASSLRLACRQSRRPSRRTAAAEDDAAAAAASAPPSADATSNTDNTDNTNTTDLPPTDGDYWAAALWGSDAAEADGGGPTYAAAGNGGGNRPFSSSSSSLQQQMSPHELKSALLDSFYGTERGLSAGIESRAEIAELIAQLEAANPPPEDMSEALRLLDGEWRLAYTSGSELLAVLALGRLPLVSVGDVTQTIDAGRGTFENAAEVSALSGAAGTTRLTARASFEALSARRIAVRFLTGGATAPKLSGALPFFDDASGLLPSSVSVAGQTLDLSSLRPALAPLEEGARAALALAGNLLASAPDLEVPVPSGGAAGALLPLSPFGVGGSSSSSSGSSSSSSSGARTWLVTTYLDEDLRISRGDGGGVFVLQKVATDGDGGGGAWAAEPAAAAAVVLEDSSSRAVVVEVAEVADEGWSTDPASSTR